VTRSTSRSRRTLAAALILATFGATTAFAGSSPKPGFHYETVETGNGASVNVITMQATEDATLLITGSHPKCETDSGIYAGFSLNKPVDVSNGKFKFDGKGTSTLQEGPSKVKVSIKGKFTSSKHAKGSYTLENCSGKVKFETDWTLGG
jgi:hypothetical protein